MKDLIAILLLLPPFLGYTQQITISGHSLSELKRSPTVSVSHTPLSTSVNYIRFIVITQAALPLTQAMGSHPSRIPQAWSYRDLAFFCKLEVKMEKATNFPIKFRLGEVQYAENREGKYGRLQQQLGN